MGYFLLLKACLLCPKIENVLERFAWAAKKNVDSVVGGYISHRFLLSLSDLKYNWVLMFLC